MAKKSGGSAVQTYGLYHARLVNKSVCNIDKRGEDWTKSLKIKSNKHTSGGQKFKK